MPKDSSPYTTAPPLADELAWLGDPDRLYLRKPKLRGIGRDSGSREFTLRYAAALDRMALREPTRQTDAAARTAAEDLWILDGWDENWEDGGVRAYVRWAFGRWLDGVTPEPPPRT